MEPVAVGGIVPARLAPLGSRLDAALALEGMDRSQLFGVFLPKSSGLIPQQGHIMAAHLRRNVFSTARGVWELCHDTRLLFERPHVRFSASIDPLVVHVCAGPQGELLGPHRCNDESLSVGFGSATISLSARFGKPEVSLGMDVVNVPVVLHTLFCAGLGCLSSASALDAVAELPGIVAAFVQGTPSPRGGIMTSLLAKMAHVCHSGPSASRMLSSVDETSTASWQSDTVDDRACLFSPMCSSSDSGNDV
jgi:hypothetical protein